MTGAMIELRVEVIDDGMVLIFDPDFRWFCDLVYMKDDDGA